MKERALTLHKRINIHRTGKSSCEYLMKYFRNYCVRYSSSIEILKIFEAGGYVNDKVCPIAREKRVKWKDHRIKTLRTKYPHGLNDRARDEDTNKPVGLQFPSISRVASRTAWSGTKTVPTANTTGAIFEQIHLINGNYIKNVYFHERVILNTVKKKILKQLADRILNSNNDSSNLQQNLDEFYIYILGIIDSKLYRSKASNKNYNLKTFVLSLCKTKLLSTSNSLKYLTNLIIATTQKKLIHYF